LGAEDFVGAWAMEVFSDLLVAEGAFGEEVPCGVVGEGAAVGLVDDPLTLGV